MRLCEHNHCIRLIFIHLRAHERFYELPLPEVRPGLRHLPNLRLILLNYGAGLHQLDLLAVCDILPSGRQVHSG